MLFREVRFVGQANEKTRTVPVVISTDAPYDRGEYVEILDHSDGAVDLSRAPLPLIESHDAQRLNIGIVEQIHIDKGKLRGVARFGSSQRAEEVFRDVMARVIRGVSVGYELLDRGKRVEHASGRALKFKWRPFEVSAVSVPADINAGFYRSERTNMNHQITVEDDDLETVRPSRSQRRAQARVSQSAGDQDDHLDPVEVERERVSGILQLGTRHNLREMAERAISKGTSLEVFRGIMLDQLHRRGSDRPLENPVNEIGLTDKQARQFSVAKFLRSIVENNRNLAPFEHDCAKTVADRLSGVGIRQNRSGFFIPAEVFMQPIPGARMVGDDLMVGNRVVATRDLSTGTIAAGGAMVATDLLAANFIDLLRARTLTRSMGATVLSGLVGNVAIPRQSASVTLNWVAQSGAATESDSAFNQVTLTPKTAHGIQDVTRDLLLQGTPAVEGLVRADLLATMAVQIDLAALHGTGTGAQPTGLALTAGIGSVAGGANGAVPTWDNIVQLEEQVANANASDGLSGYLTNSRVRSRLKRSQKFTGTNGQEIWEKPMPADNPGMFGMLNGYRAGVSNNVRNDLTKGTSTGVCSALFFGNWSDLIIGEWGTVELLPDPLTQAANRIIRMHVYQTVDIAVRRPASFAAMLDALTT